MKKRLLSALLALALVFVLLPTTALAEEVTTNGDISIAGKGWNFKKSTSGGYETVYYQVQSKNGVFSTLIPTSKSPERAILLPLLYIMK